MNRKRKKIILGVLAIIIGLPVALVVMVLVWTSIADKANGAIVSSGVTRRYLLYVPKTYDRSRLTPLVITMHGGGSWPAAAIYISRWNEVAEQPSSTVLLSSTRLEAAPFGVDSAQVHMSGPWGHVVLDGKSDSFPI